MSDLSLLAAALARVTAADQPNPNQAEPPAIAGPSEQTKHHGLKPIALQLHQASVETYKVEFSPAAVSKVTPDNLAIRVIPLPGAAPVLGMSHLQQLSQRQDRAGTAAKQEILAEQSQREATTLAHSKPVEMIANRLPESVKLSLRPILTRQGGSISALAPTIRPIALKLHQASIETYATTIATAPRAPQAVTALGDRAHPGTSHQPGSHKAPPTSSTATQKATPRVTTSASFSPATLALGMAQAAGAEAMAQSNASQAASPPATHQSSTSRSLLDIAPHSTTVELAIIPPNQSEKSSPPSAVQAAIALDRKVRAELAQEDIALSTAQKQRVAEAPLWSNPIHQAGPESDSRSSNIVQLPPETVARAQAAPGTVATSPEPTIALTPKQAIAIAPNHQRTAPQPNLSPWQLPQPSIQLGPRSGPQLYQQRLAALKQGRLYSRLPIDSFKAIWQGVRHKPSYGQWKRLLAAEARAIGQGQGRNRLSIILGDSLSLWLPMQQLPNSQLWLNQGISGDTTAGILKRLGPLKSTNPSHIYVMAGVNDLKNGASDDQVAENLQQIMRRLRQQHPQAQIHVQSILPASIGLPPGRIRNLNARIARIANAEQVAFLDIYPQFAAPNGQLIAQLTTDGIHLSPQGYAIWQSILHRMAEPWAFANQGGKLGRS